MKRRSSPYDWYSFGDKRNDVLGSHSIWTEDGVKTNTIGISHSGWLMKCRQVTSASRGHYEGVLMPRREQVQLLDTVRRYMVESDITDMRSYGTSVLRHLDRFLMRMNDECRRLRLQPSDQVLDIGCGYGWQALTIHLISGATVHANDIRPLMIQGMANSLSRLCIGSVRPLLGDVCELDLKPQSFQAVICHQTLEHVHDEDRMLDVIASVLAPGGRYMITNDNNALCQRTVLENTEMWARRDTDWRLIEKFRESKPLEAASDEPYAVMRERIVREASAGLRDGEVAAIVHATAGCRRHEIELVAKRYVAGAPLPERPRHSWCRNPETGEYCERLIDPFEVAIKLRDRGLTANVRHGFTRWPLRVLNGIGFRVINTRLFQFRPYFEISGVRNAG